MKIYFYKILPLLLFIAVGACVVSCGDDDKDNDLTHNTNNNGTQNGDSDKDKDKDDIMDEILHNTTFKTTYKDFFFETEIKTRLTDKILNKKFSHGLMHCTEEDSENGVEFEPTEKNIKALKMEVSSYQSGGYLYSKFKFPGSIYFAMMTSLVDMKGEWSADYSSTLGNFNDFLNEYQYIQNQLETKDFAFKSEREIRERMEEIEDIMEEIMSEARYDYYQLYHVRYNGHAEKLGEWHYY